MRLVISIAIFMFIIGCSKAPEAIPSEYAGFWAGNFVDKISINYCTLKIANDGKVDGKFTFRSIKMYITGEVTSDNRIYLRINDTFGHPEGSASGQGINVNSLYGTFFIYDPAARLNSTGEFDLKRQ